MTLQLLHSDFPYMWGKFSFLFYQCRYKKNFRNYPVKSTTFTVYLFVKGLLSSALYFTVQCGYNIVIVIVIVIVLRASSALGQTGGGEGRCGGITGSLELVLDVYSVVGIVLCMGRGGEWGGPQPMCGLSGGVW